MSDILDELIEEPNNTFSIIAHAKSKKVIELTGLGVLCFCIGFAGDSSPLFLFIHLVGTIIIGLAQLFGVLGFFYSIRSILSKEENSSKKWFAFGINLICTAVFIFSLGAIFFLITMLFSNY